MRSATVKKLVDVCACGPLEIENSSPLFETSLAHLHHALVVAVRSKDWLRWLKWSLRHWLRLSGPSSVIGKMDVGDWEIVSPLRVPFLHPSWPRAHQQAHPYNSQLARSSRANN